MSCVPFVRLMCPPPAGVAKVGCGPIVLVEGVHGLDQVVPPFYLFDSLVVL